MAIRSSLSIMGLYIYDDSIFSLMELPEGVDADTVKQGILMECADMELWLPDWDVMHNAIQLWSRKNLWKWAKLYASTQFVYNPIWNKDGTITEINSGDNTGTVTAENQVSGYNVNTYSPESKQTTTPNTKWTENRKRTEQGNIGVTESSAMVRHEMELRADFNIYSIIANDFKKHYCLMVY